MRAGWPAIGAIALAVVLAHSGVLHLEPAPALAAHYRTAVGAAIGRAWSESCSCVAAGGLCFRRTRVMTAAAFAAIVLIAIGNQLRTDRVGVAR